MSGRHNVGAGSNGGEPDGSGSSTFRRHRAAARATGQRIGRTRLIFLSGWLVVAIAITVTAIVNPPFGDSSATDCGETVPLQIATPPAYAETIEALGRSWAKQEGTLGPCTKVGVTPVSNAEALEGISNTWYPALGKAPNVWIPDSSLWLQRMVAQRADAASAIKVTPIIAWSPVVLAMPHLMAGTMVASPDQPSLSDVRAMADDTQGWGMKGHAEWGQFRLAIPDPSSTTEGVSILLAAVSSAVGKPVDKLTPADVSSAASVGLLRDIEQSAARFPDSVSSVLDAYRGAGDTTSTLKYISAVAATEFAVWQFNEVPAQVPLAAEYLSTEVPSAELLFTTLLEASTAEKTAAGGFAEFLQSPEGRTAIESHGLRSGAVIDGTQPPFVGKDKYLAPTAEVDLVGTPSLDVVSATQAEWGNLRQRTDALALIDVSGSMAAAVPGSSSTRLQLAVQAILDRIPEVPEDAQGGLWSFTTENGQPLISQLVPLAPYGAPAAGGSQLDAMESALAALTPRAGTPLFDAVVQAYESVLQAYRPGRKAVLVVLSDGQDEGSKKYTTVDACVAALEALQDPNRPVPIMMIGFGPEADSAALNTIADATGGKVYPVTTAAELQSTLPQLLFG